MGHYLGRCSVLPVAVPFQALGQSLARTGPMLAQEDLSKTINGQSIMAEPALAFNNL